MLKRLMGVLLFGILLMAGAHADSGFVEGKDYTLLSKPSPMVLGHQVVVQEFFWYGCPHCFHLLPFLDAWQKKQPAWVRLELVPAALTPLWQIDARAFYAAQARGVATKLHNVLFHSIHGDESTNLVNDPQAIARFYESHGAGPHFLDLMNSMVIFGKVNYAAEQARNDQIEGVPSLVIDGKYLVDYHAGEPERMLQVVDYLVHMEHALVH